MADSQRNDCWIALLSAIPNRNRKDWAAEPQPFSLLSCAQTLSALVESIGLSVQPHRPVPASILNDLMTEVGDGMCP